MWVLFLPRTAIGDIKAKLPIIILVRSARTEHNMAKDHPTGKSNLYKAVLSLKTPEECFMFFQDVCSYSELSAMEQRYDIAEMLQQKCIYTEIMERTGASSAIISRVSRVLGEENSLLKQLSGSIAAQDKESN